MAAWRLLIIAFAALLLAGCGHEAPVGRESYVFGTRVEVLVWGQGKETAETAIGEVLREFDRIHRTYHAWQPSDLQALNEAIAAGKPHKVSLELTALIRESATLSARGEHLFDPGVGSLVALWGFHSEEFKPQLPDADKLAALQRAHPSIADLKLDGDIVSSRNRLVALDFGGYLKGVALDRAAAIFRAKGINNALINIGGNVMALGSKGGVPWRVGIQHPRSPAPLATLELRDGEAIGTSGDYQRFFEIDGRRYCHLIDPRRGEPSRDTQAVTVLVPPGEKAGMLSDVTSKPLFIAGADWPRLAAALGQRSVLRVDAEGRVQVTAALRPRLKFEAPDLKIEELP
ncbi:MAG: FAD:protein FMN transferase [Rhodocyclaceae bacterium]|nr:FAD:protein FMN transferase [Rhodocyclaceae bacterium]